MTDPTHIKLTDKILDEVRECLFCLDHFSAKDARDVFDAIRLLRDRARAVVASSSAPETSVWRGHDASVPLIYVDWRQLNALREVLPT